jgi:hypothetical protein
MELNLEALKITENIKDLIGVRGHITSSGYVIENREITTRL